MSFFDFAVENARDEFTHDVYERDAFKWLAKVEQHWRDQAERDEQFRKWAAKETGEAVWGAHD